MAIMAQAGTRGGAARDYVREGVDRVFNRRSRCAVLRLYSGLSMAEKLRLWKAAKAASVTASTSSSTTAVASKAVAKTGGKRAFAEVRGNKPTTKTAHGGPTKKAKGDGDASSVQTQVIPAAHGEEEEDANADLGISFSSTEENTPPKPLATVTKSIGTPIASNLRAQLLGADEYVVMQATTPAPAASAVRETPRAAKLREAMQLTPPTATRSSNTIAVTMTPVAAALRADAFVMSSSAVKNGTTTPHAERLREALRSHLAHRFIHPHSCRIELHSSCHLTRRAAAYGAYAAARAKQYVCDPAVRASRVGHQECAA